jgi:hypothetical protein
MPKSTKERNQDELRSALDLWEQASSVELRSSRPLHSQGRSAKHKRVSVNVNKSSRGGRVDQNQFPVLRPCPAIIGCTAEVWPVPHFWVWRRTKAEVYTDGTAAIYLRPISTATKTRGIVARQDLDLKRFRRSTNCGMVLLYSRTHHDAFDPCRDIQYLQDTMHFLGFALHMTLL